MTPQQHRDMFEGALWLWLEANGVTFDAPLTSPPFAARIDLNKLKAGMKMLISAYSGETG